MDPTFRPSPRRQLRGTRPPPLRVSKDSTKIRKPPPQPAVRSHATTSGSAALPPSDAPCRPIYDAFPKTIHAKPSDFMSLVLQQHLIGQNSDEGPAAMSHAARFASIERSVTPHQTRNPTDVIEITEDVSSYSTGPDPGLIPQPGPLSRFPPGILSPMPSNLLPVSPGLFSPLNFDPSCLPVLNDPSPVFQAPIETMDPIQVNSLFDGSPVYGREDDKNRIIGLVLSDDCKTHNVTSICIVAPSGTGKSTMAHLVYNEEAVCEAFDARVFICTPQKFDEKMLMMEMIESLTASSCRETEMDQLEDILVDELIDKKILLVLDDAENENQFFWNNVMALLKHGSKGSVLLVTTDSKVIADVMDGYYLRFLSDYCCWLIFVQYAFGDLNVNAYPELEQIGKQLIAKCRNNLLCIKVLGQLLSRSQDQQFWIAILENNLWESNGFAFPALQICYSHMAMHLKKCLEYLSLFPKGHVFLKHQIVCLWISSGLVIPVEGREPEGVVGQYFDELIFRGFIEHSPIHNAKEDIFIMHDLIRNLAENNAQSECFRSESSLVGIPKDCILFSLVPSECLSDIEKPAIKESTKLQTLLVVIRPSLPGRVFSILSFLDLNDLFVKFRFLKTLDLSYTDIMELPGSIGLLRNLSYLGISGTKITSLPREFCTIISLQTLEAKDCYHFTELPKNLKELSNLRHLDVIKKSSCVKMPVGIGHLTNLRILTTFNVGDEKQQCGIEELKDLNHLSGCLQIAGLENIESGASAKEANLKSKVIETLRLQWRGTNRGDGSTTIAEEVFENSEPNNRLKELIVRNYIGSQFPVWIGDPSFTELVSIIIDKCINCSKFPLLGVLPSLRQLSIQKIYHVKRLDTTSCRVGTNCVFTSLENLNIWEMYDLEELFEVRDGDFPCLRTLSINRCPMLKNIPCFPSLIELSIYCCINLPCIPDLSSLSSLRIDGFQKMKSLDLPCNLPMLKSLEIRHCGELLTVEKLSNFSSLEKLNVDCCPKFASLDGWVRIDLKAKRCSFVKEKLTKHIEAQQEPTKLVEDTLRAGKPFTEKKLMDPPPLSLYPPIWAYDARTGVATRASSLTTFESPEQSLGANKSSLEVDEGDPKTKRRKPSWALTNVKSQDDHVEDGYKWRKYCQTLVKGSSFSRHYYMCAYVGCSAKKRVDRSLEDPTAVTITYTGTHNHQILKSCFFMLHVVGRKGLYNF